MTADMRYPAFYDAAPRLHVRDPLSAFLGAAEGGVIEYSYLDAVKLAGHSCPTVAGAYLMTVRALARLYAGELPVRGEIEVILRDGAAEGTTGVVANVASLLTGAAQEGGFKGIAGRFDRRHLLSFGGAIGAEIAFRRRDTGAVVGAAFDATIVPFEPAARALLQRLMAGGAGAAEAAEFRHLWQDRVRRILIDHAEDPRLVLLSRPAAAADAPAPHH